MTSRGTRFAYESSWGTGVPTTLNGFGSQLNVANWFTVSEAGFIVGMRYYRQTDDDGEHYGQIRLESDNSPLGVCTFKKKPAVGSSADGWQHAYFRPRIRISSGTMYYACVFFSRRRFRLTPSVLGSPITTGRITVGADTSAHWNGAFGGGISLLNTHDAQTRYGVDILYLSDTALA